MILKISDVDWHVHFHTSACSDETAPWCEVVKCLVHTGPCVLTHMAPKHCVNGSVGVANCSKKDRFDGAVGYRLALTRAIEHHPAVQRQQIWDAYWLRMRKPRHEFDSQEAADKLMAKLGLDKLGVWSDTFEAIQVALNNAYAHGLTKGRSRPRVEKAA